MKKRLISSVLTLLLVCTTAFTAVSAASAEWQPEKQVSIVNLNDTLVYQVMLKANIGAANANKPVVCRVIQDTDSWSGLTDSKIVYIDQAVADAQGYVSVALMLNQYGAFKANFRVMDGETSQDVTFNLLTQTELSDELALAVADSDTAAYLVANSDKFNIDTTYYTKLTSNATVHGKVNAKKNQMGVFNAAEILEDEVILEYIKTATDKLDIANCLISYEGKRLALGEQANAKNIYATFLAMTDAQKTAAMTLLQSYAPATIASVADAFNKAVIFGAIQSMDKIALDKVVKDNNDLLGLSGYESLGDASRTEFLGCLQTAWKNSNLNTLTDVKTSYDNWKNPGGGTGGGIGGGTGGTTGGAISNPTQTTPDAGNGTLIGGLGAFGTDTGLIKGEFPESLDIATSFLDLGDVEWAETAIRYLGLLEIVNGKGDRMFCPNDSVTREEFVKIIVNAFDVYDKDATCNFTDIPADHWAYSYVASAVKSGLIFGVSDNEFGEGSEITREQMATIIYRLMVKMNDIERMDSFPYEFEDMDEVSNYARYGILMLYNCGYIQGDNGKFYPRNTATRAESAQMIYNILVGNINKPGQTEGGSAE